jgi:subtilisin family serine protease
MTPHLKNLQRQVERIADEAEGSQVEVIVQMDIRGKEPRRPSVALGQALSRRRLSLTPRDLLPAAYGVSGGQERRAESASAHLLVGKATTEMLTLTRIQKVGASAMNPLLKSGLVSEALARMAEPKRKSAAPKRVSTGFWTSRAMPLRLPKNDLQKLPSEVENIRAIHRNRRLSIPTLMETKPLRAETDEILASTWGLEYIKALAAWGAHEAKGKGVLIGLLDTGVDASHPDLKGKVRHWAEFDSLGAKKPNSKPRDSDEHGTHCAGTLVGGAASGRRVGVAPEARLAAALALDGEEGGTDAQILAGIQWAVETGVDVISMSLGGLWMDAETPPTYTEAIYTCNEAGIPVVAAIGNEGQETTGSPGNDLFALSVGAIDQKGRVAGFSGGRTQIIRESEYIDSAYLPLPYSKPDLSAPGVAVYSSVPNAKWKAFNGTSMAAPHVAGGIALLLSGTTIREKETGLQRTNLVQDLMSGSVDDAGESGQDHRYGFGILNILRAIDLAKERGY